MNDNETKLLNEIKKQIERFDGKTNILLAISGILLGMSFGWITILKDIFVSSNKITAYFLLIFISLDALFLCLAIIIFIWSILPRNKPKKISKIKTNNSIWYYKDLQNMKVKNIKKGILKNQENYHLSEQIKINSIIASKKHKILVLGIIFLLLSIFSIVISVLLYIFI